MSPTSEGVYTFNVCTGDKESKTRHMSGWQAQLSMTLHVYLYNLMVIGVMGPFAGSFHPSPFDGWFVSKITQKQHNWFPRNLVEKCGMGQERNHTTLVWIGIRGQIQDFF